MSSRQSRYEKPQQLLIHEKTLDWNDSWFIIVIGLDNQITMMNIPEMAMPRDDFKRARDKDVSKLVTREVANDPLLHDEVYVNQRHVPRKKGSKKQSRKIMNLVQVDTRLPEPSEPDVSPRNVHAPCKLPVDPQINVKVKQALADIQGKNVTKRQQSLLWFMANLTSASRYWLEIEKACQGTSDFITQQRFTQLRRRLSMEFRM